MTATTTNKRILEESKSVSESETIVDRENQLAEKLKELKNERKHIKYNHSVSTISNESGSIKFEREDEDGVAVVDETFRNATSSSEIPHIKLNENECYISSEEETCTKDLSRSMELALKLKEECKFGKLDKLDKERLYQNRQQRASFQSDTLATAHNIVNKQSHVIHDDMYFSENKTLKVAHGGGEILKSKSDDRMFKKY